MIEQFHPDSQKEFARKLKEVPVEKSGFRPLPQVLSGITIGSLNDALKLAPEARAAHFRKDLLRQIGERRRVIFDTPGNHWHIYELCKVVYELAEIDRVDFNGASISEKFSLIGKMVPFASGLAVKEAVEEYHISRERQGWRMHWIVDEEAIQAKQKEDVVLEAAQMNLDIMFSFIRNKGLISEYQTYVEQYELIHDGQAG